MESHGKPGAVLLAGHDIGNEIKSRCQDKADRHFAVQQRIGPTPMQAQQIYTAGNQEEIVDFDDTPGTLAGECVDLPIGGGVIPAFKHRDDKCPETHHTDEKDHAYNVYHLGKNIPAHAASTFPFE